MIGTINDDRPTLVKNSDYTIKKDVLKGPTISFPYKIQIRLIKEFLLENKIETLTQFQEYVKNCKERSSSYKKEIKSFIQKTYRLRNPIEDLFQRELAECYLQGRLNEDYYESITKGERTIDVIDINGQVLSKTTKKRAEFFKEKGKGDWIGEKRFQLNHIIREEEVQFIETVFNRVLKNQKGCCNRCKKEISFESGELHHRYIPQCFYLTNSDWNVEIVCPECHNIRHKNPVSLVNILIELNEVKKQFNSWIKTIKILGLGKVLNKRILQEELGIANLKWKHIDWTRIEKKLENDKERT